MSDDLITSLVQATEGVLNSGGRPPKPDKLTVYDDYDLWEDRMKVYLEAVEEGARSAAILGWLDNKVYTVARAVSLTASLTPVTIFERLRCEFRRSSMPWVARATLKSRRQHADESVVDFFRHLRVLACSSKVALNVAQREKAIHTAYPLAQVSSPSALGCHQAFAPIQDSSVDVFAMGQRQSRDISKQTAQWQWGPLQPNPLWRGSPQPPTPWRGSPQPLTP
ncbi:unnamed protein product [Schistocephalus solidus]|uniref:Retrotrans_gag domain-containing protein n=1 Tax=Schistocephalus solidus TaxID=70667 RepID=A0A183SQH5_SCHSO|nr:unnamed protein product [Schistocephalus solidus]